MNEVIIKVIDAAVNHPIRTVCVILATGTAGAKIIEAVGEMIPSPLIKIDVNAERKSKKKETE